LLFGSLLPFVERKKSNRLREVMQKAAAISAKPAGVWAGSQSFILAGKRSGLLTHIAATESVLLRRPMEKLTAFVELELAIRTCGKIALTH
jgi:hypothetical protein